MTDSTQLTSRDTLDIVIQRTITIYRWAVMASFAMLGIGFLFTIFADQEVDTNMATPAELLRQVIDLEASGFFGIGIGLMILTPIVMIASAAVTFFGAEDKRYGLITSAVAAILLLSIVVSFVIG